VIWSTSERNLPSSFRGVWFSSSRMTIIILRRETPWPSRRHCPIAGKTCMMARLWWCG